MKRLILYIILLTLIIASCDKDTISPGQTDKFIKYYGGLEADHGNDVKQLPDGGYYVIGTINAGDQTDVFTLITDEYGNTRTDIKTFDGNHLNDKASRMQLLADGGAVAIGTYQQATGNNDIWLMRFNNRGDTVWTRKYGKSYGDDEGYNLIINKSGNIVAIGYTDSLAVGGILDKQIWIHSVNPDGVDIWQKGGRSHGFVPLDEELQGIVEVDDGYVLAGTAIPKNSNRYLLFFKTNQLGFVGRSDKLKSDEDDQGRALIRMMDGHFLILSLRTSTMTNSSDIVLTNVEIPSDESELLIVHDETVLDDGENEKADILIYRNNKIHILGTTTEHETEVSKILLIITGKTGSDVQYIKYGLDNESMEGFGMDITKDGGFVFTGSNLTLFKTGESGNF